MKYGILLNAVWSFAFAAILLFVVGIYVGALETVENNNNNNNNGGSSQESAFSNGNDAAAIPRMKMTSPLSTGDDSGGDGGDMAGSTVVGGGGDENRNDTGSTDRVGFGNNYCSKDDILIVQSQTPPLWNGIPTYTVQIQNTCISQGCSVSDIHLSCGWFASARLIDPTVFRRIAYDDCLVNNGQAMNQGDIIRFEYANTFTYPLSVSSVTCPGD